MFLLPNSILVLIEGIKKINNVKVSCNNGEISIFAPDPGEDGEQEALDKILAIKKEAEDCGLNVEPFPRGDKFDALRIYSEKAPGPVKKYQDSVCQVCGGKIEIIACRTHEEPYEVGHKEGCLYRQVIKEGCTIE
jgi:rRNA maturation endonuclease Nob1